MSLSDLYAIGIATGYAAVAFGLWRFRAAFRTVVAFGWLIYPIMLLWVVFYGSLPFVNELVHQDWYVWVSRTAHTLSIMLVFLVARLGEAILEHRRSAGNGAD